MSDVILTVIYGEANGVPKSPTWNDDAGVAYRIHVGNIGAIPLKFGRRCDAERAIERLLELPINWHLPKKALTEQVLAFGVERIREEACSVLSW